MSVIYKNNLIYATIVLILAILKSDHSATAKHSPSDYACNDPSYNDKRSEVHYESTKPNTVTVGFIAAIEAAEV